MKKLKLNKKMKVSLALALIVSVTAGVCLINGSKSEAAKGLTKEIVAQRVLERQGKEKQKVMNMDNSDEVVRVIVELDKDAVIEDFSEAELEEFEYDEEVIKEEKKVLSSQEKVIKNVEKITGTKPVNQSALISNSFSIDCKKNQIDEIMKVSGVKNVQKVVTYSTNMATAREITGTNLVQEEYGYKGEGIVVAILDTGVNYKHEAMKVDKDIEKKDSDNLYYYSKKEMRQFINDFGHGSYFSEKVPFGYDYTSDENKITGEHNHGFHVSGIVAGNTKKFSGIAPNAKLLGLKVLDDYGYGTTDDIVKGIEDAIKLKADVLNMSLGATNGIVNDDDFMQSAINKANDCGIVCCIAAGNESATGNYLYDEMVNGLHLTDLSTVSNPAIAKGAFAVASHTDEENGQISYYSSWGTTTDLSIKPEISAPGQEIYSSTDGISEYEEFSGTSMATPVISGASALVLQSIKENNVEVEGNIAKFVKNIIMNTADAIYDENGMLTSIRQQGAGRFNVHSAINNSVLATYNGEAKIELREINKSQDITINLKNYSDEDVTFTLPVNKIYTNDTDSLSMKEVEGASITFDMDSVTVKAGENVDITAKVNIPANYPMNSFVEGFVSFDCEDHESVSLPVLGFYGDWEAEPVIDASSYYEEEGIVKKAGFDCATTVVCDDFGTGLGEVVNAVDTEEGLSLVSTYNPELAAFSPNDDFSTDTALPGITQLRNAEYMTVKVLDSNKKPIRTLVDANNCGKSNNLDYIDWGYAISPLYTVTGYVQWDGTLYNKKTGEFETAPDGQYYISVQSAVHDKSKMKETILPVKIDTNAPKVNGTYKKFDNGRMLINFKCKDDIGISPYFYIDTEDNSYYNLYCLTNVNEKGEYELYVEDLSGTDPYLTVLDGAGNMTIVELEEEEATEEDIEKAQKQEENNQEDNNDEYNEEEYDDDYEDWDDWDDWEEYDDPDMIDFIDCNIFFEHFVSSDMLNKDGTFTVYGELTDIPTEFKINGNDVKVELKEDGEEETYTFKTDINLEYGVNHVKMFMKNRDTVIEDYVYEVVRNDVIIKTKDNKAKINTSNKQYELNFDVSSYVDGYNVDVNGDNIYSARDYKSVEGENPDLKNFTYNVELEKGDNVVRIVVSDFTMHKTEKIIHINYQPTVTDCIKSFFDKLRKFFHW